MRSIGVAAALALTFAPVSSALAQAAQSISAREKAQGQEANPQLLAEYGGKLQGRAADYVAGVARRVAVQSGLSNAASDFTPALLNSSVNNAFAIPGGYIYITRQLLALMNDEAELAGVLGHEVGHVAARHSAKRQAAATRNGLFGGLLQLGAGLLLGNGALGSLANQGIGQGTNLLTLGYSRAQETQADDLGVRYLAAAGYDPMAMGGALSALQAQTNLDARIKGVSARTGPSWTSTHPDPGKRVVRADAQAARTDHTGGVRNRDAFLSAIDGIIVDDDPREGVVDGTRFRHPYLKVTFTAPQGFALSNGSDAVTIAGSGGQATFSGGALSGSLDPYVASVFSKLSPDAKLDLGRVQRVKMGRFDAAVASLNANVQGGGQVQVTVVAYQTAPATAYSFTLLTPAGSGVGPFGSMLESFATMTDAEAAAIIRPRRLSIVTVGPSDTVASLSARMAYPDYREERFRVLNALAPGEPLAAASKVKLVVLGQP